MAERTKEANRGYRSGQSMIRTYGQTNTGRRPFFVNAYNNVVRLSVVNSAEGTVDAVISTWSIPFAGSWRSTNPHSSNDMATTGCTSTEYQVLHSDMNAEYSALWLAILISVFL